MNLHLILSVLFIGLAKFSSSDSTDELVSTVEPDAAPGCAAPAIKLGRTHNSDLTTENGLDDDDDDTTQLPEEELTTSNTESVEKIDIDLSNSENNPPSGDKYVGINPYRTDSDNDGAISGGSSSGGAMLHDTDDLEEEIDPKSETAKNNRRRNKKRTSGRRRQVENDNGQSSTRGRFERHTILKRETILMENDLNRIIYLDGKDFVIPPLGHIYYVEIDDLLDSEVLTNKMKRKLHKLTKKHKILNGANREEHEIENINHQQEEHQQEYHNQQDNFSSSANNNTSVSSINNSNVGINNSIVDKYVDENSTQDFSILHNTKYENLTDDEISKLLNNETLLNNDEILQRVKRKSGKTTGALSRPKPGGDGGSKNVGRKGDKDCRLSDDNTRRCIDRGHDGDEGGGMGNYNPEEEEEEEIEEESDEETRFSEVSEIRFPGEVGPLGDRRPCKLRCIKDKWVGPLCATNEEDETGKIKYQPLYKSCHVNRIPPHLLLSYRNISVNVGWDLPHGHSLQARCKDLGLYKLLGESRVLCSNGLWAPRMPSCVPTTLLTNFSDDSPPSIRIKIGSGSGAFEPSGVLAVLPSSTIMLDCMYPRKRGTPEWTWTGWFKQYYTGWSTAPDEKGVKFRLTIKDIQNQDSGTFTCASPRGLTNSIPIVVTTSQCPQIPDPAPPLNLRLEGNKLGQRAIYRCPLGYKIEGTVNSTCLASGNWSSPQPTCQSVQCPPLYLEDPHLSLTELNTSAWGRAVFKCQWGFKLSGPPSLECLVNGETGVWSGPVPRCKAIQCPQPLAPINGRIDGTSGPSSHRRYAVGALVTFSCNEGHLLVGEASIVCTEIGFWSHPPPFCKSQCNYPGDPPNGLIAPLKFHYDPGDYLSVQCRPGFVEFSPPGQTERPQCLPDGKWSAQVPQCRSYEEV